MFAPIEREMKMNMNVGNGGYGEAVLLVVVVLRSGCRGLSLGDGLTVWVRRSVFVWW